MQKMKKLRIEFNLRLLMIVAIITLTISIIGATKYTHMFPAIPETAGILTIVLTGFMMSTYCTVRCGGLVAAQIHRTAIRVGKFELTGVEFHSLGRLVGYTIVGGIIGHIGQFINITTNQQVFGLAIVGSVLILASLHKAIPACFIRVPKCVGAVMASPVHSFVIGVLHGLNPCGPLQIMQLYCLTVGSWQRGITVMAVFWLCTLPVMWVIPRALYNYLKTYRLLISSFVIAVTLACGINMCDIAYKLLKSSQVIPMAYAVDEFGNPEESISLFDQEAAEAVAAGQGHYHDDGTFHSEAHDEHATPTPDFSDYIEVRSLVTIDSYGDVVFKSGQKTNWTIEVPEGQLTENNGQFSIVGWEASMTLHEGENHIYIDVGEPQETTYQNADGTLVGKITVIE